MMHFACKFMRWRASMHNMQSLGTLLLLLWRVTFCMAGKLYIPSITHYSRPDWIKTVHTAIEQLDNNTEPIPLRRLPERTLCLETVGRVGLYILSHDDNDMACTLRVVPPSATTTVQISFQPQNVCSVMDILQNMFSALSPKVYCDSSASRENEDDTVLIQAQGSVDMRYKLKTGAYVKADVNFLEANGGSTCGSFIDVNGLTEPRKLVLTASRNNPCQVHLTGPVKITVEDDDVPQCSDDSYLAVYAGSRLESSWRTDRLKHFANFCKNMEEDWYSSDVEEENPHGNSLKLFDCDKIVLKLKLGENSIQMESRARVIIARVPDTPENWSNDSRYCM